MRTPLDTFRNMKHRCYSPSDKKYQSYGGNGITICDQWLKNPVSFATWSENNGWAEGKHIHRKNKGEGYTPENCEWLTVQEHKTRHAAPPEPKPVPLYPEGSLSAMASLLGRKGGQAKSERKTAAVRENGKKGGRPKAVK